MDTITNWPQAFAVTGVSNGMSCDNYLRTYWS